MRERERKREKNYRILLLTVLYFVSYTKSSLIFFPFLFFFLSLLFLLFPLYLLSFSFFLSRPLFLSSSPLLWNVIIKRHPPKKSMKWTTEADPLSIPSLSLFSLSPLSFSFSFFSLSLSLSVCLFVHLISRLVMQSVSFIRVQISWWWDEEEKRGTINPRKNGLPRRGN